MRKKKRWILMVVLPCVVMPVAAIAQRLDLPPRAEPKRVEAEARRQRAAAALSGFARTWHDGRVRDAEAMIPQLAAAGASDSELSGPIAELLMHDLSHTAKLLIDRFRGAMPSETDRLLVDWSSLGETDEQMHQWLAGLSEHSDFWLKVRVRHLKDRHPQEAGQLLESLVTEVRARPAEYAPSHRLALAARVDPKDERYDWIGITFQSPNPSDYLQLSDDFGALTNADTQVGLFLHALKMPFTDADRAWVEERRKNVSVFAGEPGVAWKEELRNSLRLGLLDAYKRAGKAQEAQSLMEELIAENGGRLPMSIQYAGQIQAASGARVVEKKVLDAEEKQGNTAEYWKMRGEYFVGRREWKQAEEAFLKSLELAAPEGTPAAITKSWALSTYLNLLQRVDMPRAYAELWKRSEGLPAERVAGLLQGFEDSYNTPIRGDDERCWKVLAATERWAGSAERILMKMLELPGSSSREKILMRAAELAKGADGTRSAVLVWAMQRTRGRDTTDFLPVLPLLEYSVQKTVADAKGDSDRRMAYESAQRALWGAYLSAGQWRKAVALMPNQCDAEKSSSLDDLSAVAIYAARAGDTDDAMRYWRRVSQLDRMYLSRLAQLRETVLRDELIVFYEKMARDNPNNVAPGRALKILRSKTPQ